MGDVDVVLSTNSVFYVAFATRDVAKMETLWARRSPVSCIHPGWQPLLGRDAVLASWRDIMSGPSSPPIHCANAVVHLVGSTALVICTERFSGTELAATNVFVKEDGAWRLVHHQASGIARPSDEDAGDGETLH